MQHVEPESRRGRAGRFRHRILLLVALAGACNTDDCIGPTELFDVTGVVMVNDQPAPGVTVVVAGDTAVTQATGMFRFTFQAPHIVGLIEVVPPPGVHFRETSKVLGASSSVRVTFEGYREAAISGRTLAFGQPVGGVQLEVAGGLVVRSTTSAADGSYRFDDLPPSFFAPYLLRATAGPGGYEVGIGGTGIAVQLMGVDVTQDLDGAFGDGVRIRGSVTSSGAGLDGVIVVATGTVSAADTTNATGSYFLPLLPPGTYDIAISGFDANAHRFATTVQNVTTAMDTVVDFVAMPILPNEPPTVVIQQPTSGATFAQGSAVVLQGSATDPEDGALTGASLRWSSSLDGALGTGTSVTVPSLSAGDHTITLSATDGQGLGASASVNVTITPAPQQPGSISGSVTANGAPIGGVAVSLTGAASASTSTDGNGAYSFANLQPGTYTVTITNPFPGVSFPALSQTVTLSAGQQLVVNFAGTYGSQP